MDGSDDSFEVDIFEQKRGCEKRIAQKKKDRGFIKSLWSFFLC
jgi:hypothetical protein